jgi:hypothetical protein
MTAAAPAVSQKVRDWFVPLSCGDVTLGAAHDELSRFSLKQEDVPFLVQLVENPKYDAPGFDVFHGATDLRAHDHIHILLGRGLLPKDEAFVIGFTMGSTDLVSATEERLYTFFARNFYPRAYRFSEEDTRVFKDAVRLGFVSDCKPLSSVNYETLRTLSLQEARRALGLEEDLLRAYYAVEKRRYPQSFESQRLLD